MNNPDADHLLSDENEYLVKLHKIVKDTLKEEKLIIHNLLNPPLEILSAGQKVSDKVARFGGSWKFIIIFCLVLAAWIVFNAVAMGYYKFDPYPFILMNLILSSKSKINHAIDEIHFNEIIDNIVETFTQSGGLDIHNITVKIDENANTIFSIKSFIDSILYNLISNAIKYKSVERDLKINIDITRILGSIQIEFKDNGIGIDMQKYGDSLFGLYKRFHPKIEGKGIGLHMTKNQVESLGGNIRVESKVNDGTIFFITIPIEFKKENHNES